MPKLVVKYLLLLALALAAPASFAKNDAPEGLLQAVADEVIAKIKQDQKRQAVDPAGVEGLVESSILPLFDFVRMTQLAVARNWHLATPEQQRAITEEFKALLVRTYSTALAHYRGELVVFKQLRTTLPGADVTVRSEVKHPGQERTTLDYEMEKTPAGWKIYNVKLADICLVSTYRDLFAEKVRDGGVDGLIKFLVDENRGSRSRFNSIKASFWETSRVVYAILQNAIQKGMH